MRRAVETSEHSGGEKRVVAMQMKVVDGVNESRFVGSSLWHLRGGNGAALRATISDGRRRFVFTLPTRNGSCDLFLPLLYFSSSLWVYLGPEFALLVFFQFTTTTKLVLLI